ncbi:MAG: hypothetical protein LBT48_08005 [Prevotellaceae bacterium]|jgi:hypothetical protein|nr:hypothetical protein [Prevotellaceae bacterium]
MKTIKLISILFFVAVFCSCKLANLQDEVKEVAFTNPLGFYTEISPVESRTGMNFIDERKVLIITSGGADEFEYEIIDNNIKLIAIWDKSLVTTLSFRVIDNSKFEIENLYPSIPEDPPTYMVFEQGNVKKPESGILKGAWVDKESFGLQFIDFFSDNQARFGMYGKNFERYDTLEYRLFDNQIAIKFLSDNQETIHNLIKIDDETIEISDFTVIPENPNKTYLKRDIITETHNDTIVIGHHQIYYDFSNDFRIEIDSVLNDSRCPTGVLCDWEGNAAVRLDLIVTGNYHYQFTLNTNRKFQTDTVINDIKFELVELAPYPEDGKGIAQKDYSVKILASKVGGNPIKSNVLLLKVDYTTYTFEGGKELDLDKSSDAFTITNEYLDPGDFGSIKLFYSEIGETLFYGTIIWAGSGEILYPKNWLLAENFDRALTDDYIFPANGFEDVFNPNGAIFDYQKIWGHVQNVIKAREYLKSNPKQVVKLFLYTPSVGSGNPEEWKWIIFLKK